MTKLELYLEAAELRNRGYHDWEIAEMLHITEHELMKLFAKFGYIR